MLVTIYLLALVPVALLGLVANADYGSLGCRGATQCGDAASGRTMALVYVLMAPFVLLLVRMLRVGAGALQKENKA